MKKLVILTGSGISRESGLKTFREMGGLWEEYDVTEVASPEGWAKDRELVNRFYNERRVQLGKAEPNAAHKGLAYLEKDFDVHIITQNVDDLHERGGSTKILHLHGELTKVRSSVDETLVQDIGYKEIQIGDLCEKGSQLRPHIVWFGEAVPAIEEAIAITQTADYFVVIGTMLAVYPAASLVDYVPSNAPIYLIDPNEINSPLRRQVEFIKENATTGVTRLIEILTDKQ